MNGFPLTQAPSWLRVATLLAACMVLNACADTPHIKVVQTAPINSRASGVVIDATGAVGIHVDKQAIAAAVTRAGFAPRDEGARYRLVVAAAIGSPRIGSFVPSDAPGTSPDWIAVPDHRLRARWIRGAVLRITVVLMDVASNREVWRGTGSIKTKEPDAMAPRLLDQILAGLPRG